MSNIRPQYMPKALPKSFTTTETICEMVQEYKKDDEGEFERDEQGRKIKKGPATMVQKTIESKGGILFTFPRGHSIRLSTKEQIKQFGLSENPKLIDMASGEEVNEQGVPLSLAQYVTDAGKGKGDFGLVDAE